MIFMTFICLQQQRACDLRTNLELVRHVFAAKEVPFSLLAEMADFREFHRPDWPAVVSSVGQAVKEFDFYL